MKQVQQPQVQMFNKIYYLESKFKASIEYIKSI